MGWKTLYSMTESNFRDLYSRGEKWGDLDPYRVVIDGEEHYGAGVIAIEPVRFQMSPKIQHTYGKTRITIEYIFYCYSDAYGEADIGVVFYKNDETSKDSTGADFHGIGHVVSSEPGYNIATKHRLVVEQENGTIRLLSDDEEVGTWTLEQPLTSLKIAIDIPQASGSPYDSGIGIIVTSVKVEYYDWMEDVVNQMTFAMNIMMWVMLVVGIISMVIKAFRGGKR